MKAVISVVLLAVGSVLADMAGECSMAGYYLELGCTPVPRADNSSICPESFICPDLHPDPTKCYYRSIAYVNGAKIPEKTVADPCSLFCECSLRGEPSFTCVNVECPEDLNPSIRRQCVLTHNLDSCCSTGSVCDKDEIAKLKTCEVDGKSYKEGEKFYPDNTHKVCVCTGDWNGNTANSAICRDIYCGLEIHYQEKISKSCAPVFFGNRVGCPIYFECPSESTKVVRGLNVRNVNAQCVFGNVTLSVGDEITVTDNCTKCACDVPPLVSCTKTNSC